jgi:hypothetical protein
MYSLFINAIFNLIKKKKKDSLYFKEENMK